jgi:hypothetical protein
LAAGIDRKQMLESEKYSLSQSGAILTPACYDRSKTQRQRHRHQTRLWHPDSPTAATIAVSPTVNCCGSVKCCPIAWEINRADIKKRA